MHRHEHGWVRARYLSALRTAVASSAAPYGYTLTVWTSGAITAHSHGLPNSIDALIFMFGAVTAFAVVAFIAYGGFGRRFTPQPRPGAIWSAFHVVSTGVAIGVASLEADLLAGRSAWPVVGFSVTFIYLVVVAAKMTLGHLLEARRRP